MKRAINSAIVVAIFAATMCALLFAFLDLWVVRGAEGAREYNLRVLIPLGLLAVSALASLVVNFEDIVVSITSRRAYVAVLFAANILLVGGLGGVVNFLASKHYRTFDGTTKGLYAISERTEAVLRDLPRPVKANVIGSPFHECYPTVKATLDMYAAAAGGKLEVEWFDPGNDRDKLLAKLRSLGVNPKEIEDANVVIFECATGGAGLPRTKFVLFNACVEREPGGGFGEQQPVKAFKAESLFTEAIISVASERKTKVYFLVGHEEIELFRRSDEGQLSLLERTLRQLNYDVDTFTFDFGEASQKQDVPADADVLVIAGPRGRFSDKELERLKAFLDRGGHALVMADPILKTRPGSTSVYFENTRLDSLLKEWGITLEPSILFDPSSRKQYAVAAKVDDFASQPVVKPLAGQVLVFFTAQSLGVAAPEGSGLKVAPLLETQPSTVAVKDVSGLERTQNPFQVEHKKGPITLAAVASREVQAPTASATPASPSGTAAPEEPSAGGVGEGSPLPGRKREARLIVIGDATFATDDLAESITSNLDFAVNAIAWLTAREESVAIGPKRPEKIHLSLDADQQTRVKLLALLILPIGCALIGLAVFTGRRS